MRRVGVLNEEGQLSGEGEEKVEFGGGTRQQEMGGEVGDEQWVGCWFDFC